MSSDPELDSFKRTISLTDFAGSMGYTIDWRDSWSVKRWDGSFVMRNGQHDHIGVPSENGPDRTLGLPQVCSRRSESCQGVGIRDVVSDTTRETLLQAEQGEIDRFF